MIGISTIRRDKSCTMLVSDMRIDRRVLDQARSLVRIGWQVTVIALEIPEGAKIDDELCYPEVNIVRLKMSEAATLPNDFDEKALSHFAQELPCWRWSPHWIFGIHFLLAGLRHPASVFVAVDLPLLPVTALLAHCCRSSLVYDSHELFVEQRNHAAHDKRILQSYEFWLAPLADRIITVNESIAGILAERLQVLPPDVVLNCPAKEENFAREHCRERYLHKALQLNSSQKIILLQGGLVPEVRNLENLVSAVSLLSNKEIVLAVIGPSSPEFREELAGRARAEGTLNKRVFLLEAVSQDKLLEVTASADVGIIPYPAVDLNTYYCTPNKLFEYLAAGIPILANDLPELTRFVTGNGVGLNAPMGSSGEIAAAIDTFFSLNISDLTERARKAARLYTWEAQESQVQGIYSQVLADRDSSWLARRSIKLAEVNYRHGRQHVALEKLKAAQALVSNKSESSNSNLEPFVVEKMSPDPISRDESSQQIPVQELAIIADQALHSLRQLRK